MTAAMEQMLKSRKATIAAASILGLVVLYAVISEWRGLVQLHYVGYDYAFFYWAFQSVLHHGTSFHMLYNLPSERHWLSLYHYPANPNNQFVYPPQFAVLLSMLGTLPFYLSTSLWMVLSMVSYFAAIFLLVRMLWPRVRRIQMAALFFVALILTPFEVDIGAGNVNSILLFLTVLFFYLYYHRKKPRLAGIPLGIAILFKVTPAAILLVFLLRKQWKVSIWTGITVAVGTMITVFVSGAAPIWQYAIHFMALGQTSMRNGAAPYNQSIVGVIGLLQAHGWMIGGQWMQHLGYGLFVVVIAAGIYKVVRREGVVDWRLDMALASLCPLLFSPLVEEMHLMFAIPAIMVLFRLGYESYFQTHSLNHPVVRRLLCSSILSVLLLSLPATFAFNFIVSHWPSLAWTHIQMFVALILTYLAVIATYRHAALFRVKPTFPQTSGLLRSTGASLRTR